jgi:glucosyl-dolichyl phosphate glucuronosyltransferase
MSESSFSLTIIIPTKDRVQILIELLESIQALADLNRIHLELIVADNGSEDSTFEAVASLAQNFPVPLKVIKVLRPGKSAAANEAVKIADGEFLAFLDDDVVVEQNWLLALEEFFQDGSFPVGQGAIHLPLSANPHTLHLVDLYRTVPRIEYDDTVSSLHSLNGANFFMTRDIFNRVGGFDERLGPGASGTSEDVELAWRLTRSGFAIGYARKAIVFHRVDPSRLTEEYFRQSHRRQGASRFVIREHSRLEIYSDLWRAINQYGFYALLGKKRSRYRSKGRIYHYLGMLEARRRAQHLAQAKHELPARSPSLIK